MIEVILRTALAWAGLVVLLRLSGRRTLGEMNPVDFVALLIVGDVVQQSLIGDDTSMTTAFLVVVTLLLLSVAYAGAKSRWPAALRPLEGVPTVLVREGVPDWAQMRASRVAEAEVLEVARQNGLTEMEEIRFAVLEVSGAISIIPRGEAKA